MTDPAKDMDFGTFFSNVPYNYGYDLTKHEDSNVYGGQGQSIISYNNPEIIKNSFPVNLHAIHIQNNNELMRYYQSGSSSGSSFTPFFQMNPPHPLESTTLVVGRSVGVRLDVWMREECRILWEMDSNNTYTTRLGSDRRKLGRWVGGAVTREHANDRFIGNLLNSTYVDEEAQKVVFVKDQRLQGTSPAAVIAGIQDDLKQLNELVVWVNRDFYNPFQSAPTPDNLKVYADLYPGDNNLPSNLAELKDLSYILCHNFLYFEACHRFSFASMYRSLRQGSKSFKSDVRLSGPINEIDENWHRVLPSSDQVLDKIYWARQIHEKKEGLVHFIRSCRKHYKHEAAKLRKPNLTEKELDEKLLNLFPNAIHRAFNALVKGGIANGSIVEAMKEAGIDFTKE